MENISENKELTEWQSRLEWIHPSEIEIGGDELHWKKISRETALESFLSLDRMRPFLDRTNLFEKTNFSNCREKLSGLKNENGDRLFDEQDLRFFDLYFGDARIKVDRLDNGFDVTNGRHRLFTAKQNGIGELPVLLSEKVSKENFMSSLEFGDIEKEALEQHEEAEEMKTEIERHKERAAELEEALQKIRAASAEIGSDKLRETEQRAEEAKLETERKLEEIKKRRDELLWENKELAGKVIVQNEKRREVHQQVSRIKMMFEGASDEFKSQINRAGEALNEELENMAELEENLIDVRRKLENLDV
ncbi:hypothetical protein BH20ACI4_BH20ACI4_22920 [soil metagenome]